MDIVIEKIPGGLSVDGLALKNGKCGCTAVLPCCYSWSKVKRTGNSIIFIGKSAEPDGKAPFVWSYTVKKGEVVIEVSFEDARDKKIFSGYYPPALEEWTAKGWEVLKKEGEREDFNVWRCAACRWLYKEQKETGKFQDLPDDWKCPVCKAGKESFEQIG